MKEQNITKNITSPQVTLEALQRDFAHCFDKDGDFDIEKFKREIAGAEVNFSKESYGMDWLGKSYARVRATDPATTLLKEDVAWNSKEENKNSENLLIKGDNLEVLKHLSNAYHEQIKMIYIDPPYNTGTDGFVYEDDRKFTPEEFAELAGVDLEQAKRILDFVDSKSNSHSAWLSFMYPRLYIARQLLKDDGVIFVSIDDNEVAQLKILMNEVFGETNFIAHLIWKNKKGGGNDSKYIAIEHESILVFAKSKNDLERLFHRYTDEYKKRYKEEDEDGLFFWDTFKRKSGKQYYSIKCPDGSTLEKDEFGNPISWLRSESTFKKDLKRGEIRIVKIGDQWSVQFKQRLPEGKKPRSILDSFGTTSDGSDECFDLFKKHIFSNPKPTSLISHMLDIVSESNDIILDFFGGSGTTADAVMRLNTEDSGSRKFLVVQISEKIDPIKNKVAYDFVKSELKIKEPNIFDITKERLVRAAKKIKEEHKDSEHIASVDFGFKIFETVPQWDGYVDEPTEYDNNLKIFDVAKLKDNDIATLLTTWKTYDSIPLTTSLTEVDLGGYTGYYNDNKLYLVHAGFTAKHLTALLKMIDTDTTFSPATIIIFGYHFDSARMRELAENVKSYANKKSIDIECITRY
ncbi:site-specific DNA-methyltransferase [Patescibacteria group bacterium]|nr:site-specific DNA-methyltransferase [Patescibacteria group bacterium]